MVRLLQARRRRTNAETSLFQSHNGAIAADLGSERIIGIMEFQSHNGAIAANTDFCEQADDFSVSIPQWCDCCLNAAFTVKLASTRFNPTMVRLLRDR